MGASFKGKKGSVQILAPPLTSGLALENSPDLFEINPLVIRKHTLKAFNLLKFTELYFMVQNVVHLDESSMCVLLRLRGKFCKCQLGKVN